MRVLSIKGRYDLTSMTDRVEMRFITGHRQSLRRPYNGVNDDSAIRLTISALRADSAELDTAAWPEVRSASHEN
jgi:hypothetical protein